MVALGLSSQDELNPEATIYQQRLHHPEATVCISGGYTTTGFEFTEKLASVTSICVTWDKLLSIYVCLCVSPWKEAESNCSHLDTK